MYTFASTDREERARQCFKLRISFDCASTWIIYTSLIFYRGYNDKQEGSLKTKLPIANVVKIKTTILNDNFS